MAKQAPPTQEYNEMIIISVILAGILLLLFAALLFRWGPFKDTAIFYDFSAKITNFEECKDAGYPIMESYPEQCKGPDGKTFTRELTEEEKDEQSDEGTDDENPLNSENEDYYGMSTFAKCTADEDCEVMGCNAEICGGKDEDPQFSICIEVDKDKPKDAGYSCGCVESQCRWNK